MLSEITKVVFMIKKYPHLIIKVKKLLVKKKKTRNLTIPKSPYTKTADSQNRVGEKNFLGYFCNL